MTTCAGSCVPASGRRQAGAGGGGGSGGKAVHAGIATHHVLACRDEHTRHGAEVCPGPLCASASQRLPAEAPLFFYPTGPRRSRRRARRQPPSFEPSRLALRPNAGGGGAPTPSSLTLSRTRTRTRARMLTISSRRGRERARGGASDGPCTKAKGCRYAGWIEGGREGGREGGEGGRRGGEVGRASPRSALAAPTRARNPL